MGYPQCKAPKEVCTSKFEILGKPIDAKVILEKAGLINPNNQTDICKMNSSEYCMSKATYQTVVMGITKAVIMYQQSSRVSVEPPANLDGWSKKVKNVVKNLLENPNEKNINRAMKQIDTLAKELKGLWVNPARLRTKLVIGTLRSKSRAYEAVSFLRVIAIATGQMVDSGFSSEQAALFVSKVLEFNSLSLGPKKNQPGSKLAYHLLKYAEKMSSSFKYSKYGSEVKVASIQFQSDFADTLQKVDQNIRKLASLIERAAKDGAKFVVTPEATVHGYAEVSFTKPRDKKKNPGYRSYFFVNGVQKMWCHDSRVSSCSSGKYQLKVLDNSTPVRFVDVAPVALERDSKKLEVFATITKEYNTYVAIGYIEKAGKGAQQKIHNSVNVYGPSGDIVYHYRKSNLWKPVDKHVYTEAKLSKKPYFDTPYGRFSAAICYDGNSIFPELSPFGVETLLYSVAWVSGGPSKPSPNYQMIGSKVKRDPMNVVMANWVWPDNPSTRKTLLGSNAEIWGSGLSFIMDKNGGLRGVVQNNDNSEILYSSIPSK